MNEINDAIKRQSSQTHVMELCAFGIVDNNETTFVCCLLWMPFHGNVVAIHMKIVWEAHFWPFSNVYRKMIVLAMNLSNVAIVAKADFRDTFYDSHEQCQNAEQIFKIHETNRVRVSYR